MAVLEQGIEITDQEMPEAIRGRWTGMTILRNGTPLTLGGHSDAVVDFIEAAVVRSGAKTKDEVLRVLDRLAAEVSQSQVKPD